MKPKVKKRLRATILHDIGKSTAAVSKSEVAVDSLLSSPRLEILVFNDRPMG